jgi:hypothetical protein
MPGFDCGVGDRTKKPATARVNVSLPTCIGPEGRMTMRILFSFSMIALFVRSFDTLSD